MRLEKRLSGENLKKSEIPVQDWIIALSRVNIEMKRRRGERRKEVSYGNGY